MDVDGIVKPATHGQTKSVNRRDGRDDRAQQPMERVARGPSAVRQLALLAERRRLVTPLKTHASHFIRCLFIIMLTNIRINPHDLKSGRIARVSPGCADAVKFTTFLLQSGQSGRASTELRDGPRVRIVC